MDGFNRKRNIYTHRGFPGGAVVKNPPASAGDTGRALVWEDPTGRGTAKPMHQNY